MNEITEQRLEEQALRILQLEEENKELKEELKKFKGFGNYYGWVEE